MDHRSVLSKSRSKLKLTVWTGLQAWHLFEHENEGRCQQTFFDCLGLWAGETHLNCRGSMYHTHIYMMGIIMMYQKNLISHTVQLKIQTNRNKQTWVCIPSRTVGFDFYLFFIFLFSHCLVMFRKPCHGFGLE